jgi:hypothetical protein
MMNTSLDDPPAPASERLRSTMAAVRISFTWLGVRKTLSPEQKAQAADTFGAKGTFLSAGKKLLDTTHPAYKAVTAVRGKILGYWKSVTLPFPEPGIRLLRQADVNSFDARLASLREELTEAVTYLDERFHELKNAARDRLGSLFNSSDYPESLRGLFGVAWDYPSVEPPPYLQQLSPELYRQECERVTARFDEAIRLAEQAFTEELAKLVSHLTERLSGTEDGKPKVFRDSAVEHLTEFFQRFKLLNVRSNEQLDELVERAQRVVCNVTPQSLREDQTTRQRVATQLAGVQSVLDGLLVDQPRRRIIRAQPKSDGGVNGAAH